MSEYNVNIIELSIKGDKKALVKLLKDTQNQIYSTLFYLKKDTSDISDIMQNVLIKVSNKIQTLKNPLLFKTWLNHIILNTYYDYLRKNKLKKNLDFFNFEDKYKSDIDPINNPQDNILYTELDKVIKKSISSLPIHYKIPITLREIQGLTYNEISNITNTSVGTVKSRIARARSLIKEEIKKYENT